MSFGNKDQQEKTRSILMKSLEGFANFVAVVITFFGAPLAYQLTAPFVREFTRNHYSYELVPIADGCWIIIVGGLVFFGARISTTTLILAGGIVLAARLWS